MQTNVSSCRIAAVIVTYNRLPLLKECIAALREQSRRVDEIIVVDNSCTDGSTEWLATQADVTHLRRPNEGGAGGFYHGIQAAFQLGHDWFWIMDDDTIPTPGALEAFVASEAFAKPDTGFLTSLVRWTDGAIHRMNAPWFTQSTRLRHRLLPFDAVEETNWLLSAIDTKQVRIESSTFVSALISRRAVEQVGLPLRKMFIWLDDAEYTMRIASRFPSYLILCSEVVHKTKTNRGPDPLQPDKYKYLVRNMIVTLRAERTKFWIRWFKISAFCALTLKRMIVGELKLPALYWLAKGFFFDLRPEFPAPAARPAERAVEPPSKREPKRADAFT